jgi:hypothetical protein
MGFGSEKSQKGWLLPHIVQRMSTSVFLEAIAGAVAIFSP